METRDCEFALAPGKWPRWPWLPLKRIRGTDYDCGLLHADDAGGETGPVKVYDANVCEVRTYWPPDGMPVANEYATWADFCNSDWLVD